MITPLVIFITLAVLCSTADRLISKYVLRRTNAYAFSLLTQFISVILIAPFVITQFTLPTATIGWIIALIAGSVWAIASFVSVMATKHTPVSFR